MAATRAKQIKLTKAQRSAVEIYVTDPAHESSSFMLIGPMLWVLVDDDTACIELTEAANSADVDGAGGTALTNLCRAIREAR